MRFQCIVLSPQAWGSMVEVHVRTKPLIRWNSEHSGGALMRDPWLTPVTHLLLGPTLGYEHQWLIPLTVTASC